MFHIFFPPKQYNLGKVRIVTKLEESGLRLISKWKKPHWLWMFLIPSHDLSNKQFFRFYSLFMHKTGFFL